MRIISGTLGRRVVTIPKGLDIRPTTERVREAVFNWLASRIDLRDGRVADLFAGSGAMGIEAISRGASEVHFVERSGQVADLIRDNLVELDVAETATVFTVDAMTWMPRAADVAYDVVFADPPYGFEDLDHVPDAALRLVRPGGFLIVEHGLPGRFEAHPSRIDDRKYGRTRVAYFAPPEPPTAEGPSAFDPASPEKTSNSEGEA